MSFNLSVFGGVDDGDVALRVDEIVREKGAELVEALLDACAEAGAPDAVREATFSGPSGSVNLLAVAKAGRVQVTEPTAGEPGAGGEPEEAEGVEMGQ